MLKKRKPRCPAWLFLDLIFWDKVRFDKVKGVNPETWYVCLLPKNALFRNEPRDGCFLMS
jgi:hypothetical protein